MLAKFRSLQVE